MESERIGRLVGAIRTSGAAGARALTRAISAIEDGADEVPALLTAVRAEGAAPPFTLGITGPGGAGKSTLINGLIRHYRQAGRTVGVLAVDPSSSISGGALLGDRLRMNEHNADPGVFIRSFASRSALGGLSAAAKAALELYGLRGFDVVLVETLGVGQDEVDVAAYVDCTAVLLVPGLGDSVQMAKAGTMEIADVFVINKADHPDAPRLRAQLANALEAWPDSPPPQIVLTIADRGEGIAELVRAVEALRPDGAAARAASAGRRRMRVACQLRDRVLAVLTQAVDERLPAAVAEVLAGRVALDAAAAALVDGAIEACRGGAP